VWSMKDKTRTTEIEAANREAMERFARRIVDWRMTAPAVLFLESAKPLSFLGNQALIFFQPIVQSIFNFKTYDEVTGILEDRENLEYLLRRIEALEAEYVTQHKEERRQRREARRARKTPKEGADE
jgi:hypothetical protein